MSDTSSPLGFELVRRGYDRGQVNDRLTKLVADRDSALTRITALKRIEELHLETQNAQAQVTDAEPSYAGLGARVEKILRLAEEEAKDLREEARRAADQHRELAESAAARSAATPSPTPPIATPSPMTRAARIVDKSKGEAAQLRASRAKDASAKRAEADAQFEDTRAKAARPLRTSRPSSPSGASSPSGTWRLVRPRRRSSSPRSSTARSSSAWRPRSCAPTPSAARARRSRPRSASPTTSSPTPTRRPTGSAPSPSASWRRSRTAATASTRSSPTCARCWPRSRVRPSLRRVARRR